MKKSKETQEANNYDQAVKTIIESYDKSLAEDISKEINISEKGMYHVLMVKINDRPGQAKNETIVNLQLFHPRAFKKLTKNFHILGFKNLIVLHDPLKGTKGETKVVRGEKDLAEEIAGSQGNATTAPAKTQEEIDAEFNAKVAEGVKMALASMGIDPSNATTAPDPNTREANGPVKTATKISKEAIEKVFEGTVANMTDFAKTNGIDVTGLKSRKDFIDTITAWNEDQE